MFLYVHINDQYKKSEDLEIYEMDYVSNSKLQEVCNVKQPTLFEFKPDDFLNKINDKHLFDNVENMDIKVWDVNDYHHPNSTSVDYILLPFKSAEGLFKSDTKGHYFTERNQDFLEDIDSDIRELDPFLKPQFTVNTIYEITKGSDKATTPLRYHNYYRKFVFVTSGKISVKMTPWRSKKYLHPIHDYENYDFYSHLNPWSPQKEYMNDMDKLRFLDFDIVAGYVLYIPPYWWYSIRFSSVDTTVVGLNYQTPMNICANLPDIGRYYLQFHNTKRVPARTLELNTEQNSTMDV